MMASASWSQSVIIAIRMLLARKRPENRSRLSRKWIFYPPGDGSSVYGTKPHTQARAGIPYREQSPKTKENDVIMILSSRAYITPIRLSFCKSTGEMEF